MRSSLQESSVQVSDLSPLSRAQLFEALVDEVQAIATQCAAHEALVAELRGVLDGDSVLERELAETGLARAQETLVDIGYAMERLQSGTYGSCETCRQPIPIDRLEAIPWARSCILCTGRRSGWPH